MFHQHYILSYHRFSYSRTPYREIYPLQQDALLALRKASLSPLSKFLMSALIFKDSTIELLAQDHCSLTNIPRLTLEVASGEKIVDKVYLCSRNSSPGIWNADRILILPETSTDFMVSVWIEVGRNERQLLGFMELNGPALYDALGNMYEIPLMSHENHPTLILKTRPFGIDDVQTLIPSNNPPDILPKRGGRVETINDDALAACREYERQGKLERLEHAIVQFQRAIDMVTENDPRFPRIVNSLGVALRRRFERLGNVIDLNDSIARHEAAIRLTPKNDPNRFMYLANLGNSLEGRFAWLGNLADLDNAVTSKEAAVNLIPDDHPSKPLCLNDLGNSLEVRFRRLGNIVDIDNAITALQTAVQLTPDGHPEKHTCLNNLGTSLETRFLRLGNIVDVDDAIMSKQTAIDLIPNGHPHKHGYLSNLAKSFVSRFERLGNLSDIDGAVSFNRAALGLAPDGHPGKPGYWSNLGISLSLRFKELEVLADIDDAIIANQAAVDLLPNNHTFKPVYLSNLGASLIHRFERLKNLVDINNAIFSTQNAVDLTPSDHPDRPSRLNNLGEALFTRFFYFRDYSYAQSAISNLSSSANSTVGPPIDRFNAAQRWSFIASITNHSSLLDAYESAITVMPLVAWLGLSISDRHRHLVEIGGITREAAAAAISLGQYDKAVEWLEQGRSIVWTQILQLRTPVDQLRDVNLELAESLIRVSRLLGQGQDPGDSLNGGQQSAEEKARQYRALTTERESILEQIRALPNFESFLKPPNAYELMKAAQDGPVVVLNIAKKRCDALAILPGLEDVIHIPLPNTTSEKIVQLGNQLKETLYASGVRRRGDRAAMRFTDNDTDQEESYKQMLAELWNGIVKPVLDSLAFSPHPDILPRIWWCATGPLSFLPIHAAGIYDSDSVDSQISDYAISSYIPTLSTLLDQPNHSTGHPFKLLSVIQPSAPGASSIPNTREELKCIQRHIPDRNHIVLEGAEGTKKRVMKEMEDCGWLHLACHGVQMPEEPTKSALLLEDGHLTLEEIIRLDLPKAQFAFLSACQTTTGDEKLSEEAVHIAGGMLLAGYRGVVATMWSIQDDLAPGVADEFYARLTQDDREPDSRRAAEALHMSVQKLRQKGNSLDASVELSTQEDCFLTEIAYLILEARCKGDIVHCVSLLSRKSRPGVWDADQMLIVPAMPRDFMVSVSMLMDGSEHQLLGFMELNGPALYTELGKMYEIPLICHEDNPKLVLKARILGFDRAQKQILGTEEPSLSLDDRETTNRMLHADADRALEDYEHQGNLELLNQAIMQFQNASAMVAEDNPQLPRVLSRLGAALLHRFQRLGNVTDINNSIAQYKRAIGLISDGDHNKFEYFNNLGDSLTVRSQRLGNHADIEEAIKIKQEVVDLTPDFHPDKPMYLNNLATSLYIRFNLFGNVADINDAITSIKGALDLAPDYHPKKPTFLNNLGMSLQVRFERLDNLSDIADAIVSNRAAVDLTSDGHPEKCIRLCNVGHALSKRFKRLRNIVDVDEAIAMYQAAIDITPNDHTRKPIHFNSLGVCFRQRFLQIGILGDLENAIVLIQAAVDLAPDSLPEKLEFLTSLGVCLQARFERSGNLDDIDRAIISKQAAVDLTPEDHPNKPMYLNNLGHSLYARFEMLKRHVDLDDAIKSEQMAVQLSPNDHPGKPLYLGSLGGSLYSRFKQLGNIEDIDDAAVLLQAAVNLIPNRHPERPALLSSLGIVLQGRFFYSHKHTDGHAAISNFSAAAMSPIGPPISHLGAAKAWSSLTFATHHPSLLDAYECTIVEWLEQGRSIVWKQILELRTPVEELRDVDSELAERLVQISRLLDQGPKQIDPLSTKGDSAEEKGRRYRALTTERESILEQVRALPNFENFLRPPSASQLMKAAKDGPVIILNVTEIRCDALTLIPGLEEVIHISLPNITPAGIMKLGNQLKDTLFSMNVRERGDRAAMKFSGDDIDDEGVCKQVLAELWDGVVKPVLDSLKFYVSVIHPSRQDIDIFYAAAPRHSSMNLVLSDYAISSYTPTLSILLDQPDHSARPFFKLLSVIQPSAPGGSGIPNTKEELECIGRRVPDRNHVILQGHEGTKRRVTKGMEDCSWLHLACHGIQKPDEPTKSALLLEDGHLTLEEITKLDLPKAKLAFLSACQTTTGDEKLSEEAVHIAGGMLLAGYRGVVATMWSIQDDLAPEVADEFYAHLIQDGQEPDSRKAAEALHISVQKLRQKRNVPLIAWIPFVHLGI
ncbi:hypothetical protein CPB86DRAFT_875431 [Serendipita vermifera]|nr:hypothetical protein CPB86DRAFT_875431 [Serendipita vermifera]